jgi:hypothetical protein
MFLVGILLQVEKQVAIALTLLQIFRQASSQIRVLDGRVGRKGKVRGVGSGSWERSTPRVGGSSCRASTASAWITFDFVRKRTCFIKNLCLRRGKHRPEGVCNSLENGVLCYQTVTLLHYTGHSSNVYYQ